MKRDANSSSRTRARFERHFKILERMRELRKENKKWEDRIAENEKALLAANPVSSGGSAPSKWHEAFFYKRIENYFFRQRWRELNDNITQKEAFYETFLHQIYGSELKKAFEDSVNALSDIQKYRKTALKDAIKASIKMPDYEGEGQATYNYLKNFEKNIDARKKMQEYKLSQITDEITKMEKEIDMEKGNGKKRSFLYREYSNIKKKLEQKKSNVEAEIAQIEEDRKQIAENVKLLRELQHESLPSRLKSVTQEIDAVTNLLQQDQAKLAALLKNPNLNNNASPDHKQLQQQKTELETEIQKKEEFVLQLQKKHEDISASIVLLKDFKKAKDSGKDNEKEAFALKFIAALEKKPSGTLTDDEKDVLKAHQTSNSPAGTVGKNVVDKIFNGMDMAILPPSENKEEVLKEGLISQTEKGTFMAQYLLQGLLQGQLTFYTQKKPVSSAAATEVSTLKYQIRHLQKQIKEFTNEKNPAKKQECLMRLLAASYDTCYGGNKFFDTQEAKDAGLTLKNVTENKNNELVKFRMIKAQLLQKNLEQDAKSNNVVFPYPTADDLIFRDDIKVRSQVHNFLLNSSANPIPPPPPVPQHNSFRDRLQRQRSQSQSHSAPDPNLSSRPRSNSL